MSDGIKDMYDDSSVSFQKIRAQHLENMGIDNISEAVQKIADMLYRFDSNSLILSRDKWGQLEEIQRIIRSLQPY